MDYVASSSAKSPTEKELEAENAGMPLPWLGHPAEPRGTIADISIDQLFQSRSCFNRVLVSIDRNTPGHTPKFHNLVLPQ